MALAVERRTIRSLRFGAVIVVAACGEDALGGDGTSADLAADRQGALAAKLHIGESVAGGERLLGDVADVLIVGVVAAERHSRFGWRPTGRRVDGVYLPQAFLDRRHIRKVGGAANTEEEQKSHGGEDKFLQAASPNPF